MPANTPLLLLLGGASPNAGLSCIRQAHARGLDVWLTDTAAHLEHAPDIVAAADRVSALDYEDLASCVAWATAQAQTTPLIGVFGFREFAMESVAAVADALGLPGNTQMAVQRVRNKFACRQHLREQGFPQPAAARCTSLEEAQRFADAHRPGPWIVKPLASMGSEGVSLVRDAADWTHAMQHLRDDHYGSATTAAAPFLIETFQTGQEFSAEGVFVDGQPHVLALTEKITTGAPHFVEVGHSLPATLDAETTRAVKTTVEAALRVLGLSWGNFHVEFWLDGATVVLGEVHVRPGGDFIHFMTEHVTELDLFGVVFDQLLGRPLDPKSWGPRKGAAMRFLTPPPGRVTALSGWDDVRADPQYVTGRLTLHVGDTINPLRSWTDRSSFVVATGRTTAEAIAAAERLRSQVLVEVAA